MIFVAADALSQNLPALPAKSFLPPGKIKPAHVSWLHKKHQTPPPAYIPNLSPRFYVDNLSFFCRQEIKLEKITRVPFRFRLGSVEDCDRMEGKLKRVH
jgi:hypothetical protein